MWYLAFVWMSCLIIFGVTMVRAPIMDDNGALEPSVRVENRRRFGAASARLASRRRIVYLATGCASCLVIVLVILSKTPFLIG